MYKAKNHDTMLKEVFDIIEVNGEIAALALEIESGRVVGATKSMERLTDKLCAEIDDLQCKLKAFETQYSLQFTRKDAA